MIQRCLHGAGRPTAVAPRPPLPPEAQIALKSARTTTHAAPNPCSRRRPFRWPHSRHRRSVDPDKRQRDLDGQGSLVGLAITAACRSSSSCFPAASRCWPTPPQRRRRVLRPFRSGSRSLWRATGDQALHLRLWAGRGPRRDGRGAHHPVIGHSRRLQRCCASPPETASHLWTVMAAGTRRLRRQRGGRGVADPHRQRHRQRGPGAWLHARIDGLYQPCGGSRRSRCLAALPSPIRSSA